MKKYSLDKSKIKVLLLEGIHENAIRYFEENCYTNIECCRESLSGQELEEKLKHTHIIGIRSRTENDLDASVLKDLKNIPYTIRVRMLY